MQKQNDPVDPWDARELGADEEFVQVAEYSQELEDVINAIVEEYQSKIT